VPEFVHKREADLEAEFILSGADGFNVLLIEHDVVWTWGKVKDTFSGSGYTVKEAKKECPLS